MRRVLLAVPILFLLLIPVQSYADAAVVQDSCVQVDQKTLRIYFTVVNFSLPDVLCDLHFIPEPQPPEPGCEWVNVGAPAGWSGVLDPLGGGDFFANTIDDCIPQGDAKGGFWFEVDPAFCCYIVQFTGPAGEVLLEQEECFHCTVVPAEDMTWGTIKSLYR